MPVFRRDERPSLGRRLSEIATGLGILVLVGGLVTAFVVVGIYLLHAALPRNQERHVAAAPVAPAAPPPVRAAPPPVRPAAKPDSREIAVAPPPAPPPPPSRTYPAPTDPSRLDGEGFIRYWMVLGPVPNDKDGGAAEIDPARVPNEAALRPAAGEPMSIKGKTYHWDRHRSGEFLIDFRRAIEGRGEDAWAYAAIYVVSPEERRDVRLYVGSNDQVRVYLNGQSVLAHDKTRTLKKDDMVAQGLTLRKGHNTLLLKVVNEKNAWQACVRFGDAAGTPMTDLHPTSGRE